MTPRITLRPLTVSDASVMHGVLADPTLYEFTGGEPPSQAELDRLYRVQTRGQSADGSERWVNSVVQLDDEPIGYVQATIPTGGGAAEIAWVIGRPWQGRGYAKQACRQLCDELRRAGVTAVVAHIHPDHVASQRIAAALGMQATGTVVDGEVEWEGRLAR